MSGLARRVVLAADSDRRQLERELHDGLQQDLVALIVNLQLARRMADTDPPAAQALLDDIRGEAQAALDGARALALRIFPPLLDAAGLRAALRAAAPGTSIKVSFGAQCPEEVAACVYFCCLELLPDASRIAVREEGDAIVFDVVTSGATEVARVKDRVEAFGGRLTTEAGSVTGVLPV